MTAAARWFDYWHGGVAPARPALLRRLVLLLVAFDAWIDLLPHGGRYGAGGFNVAHFAWLDALQPLPTPALYNGCVVMVGVLALVSAFVRPSRGLSAVIFGAYSYAWMMSLLDSYQHHYLLSIYLGLFVAWPEEPESRDYAAPSTTSSWAYALLTASTAVVYSYTAVSKSELGWRSGLALSRIAPEGMAPFVSFAAKMGVGTETFWPLVGHSVIAVQVVIAVGYALAPLRDRASRMHAVVAWVALFAATSFHVGAEYLDLKVGWFSYYMLLAAWCAFLPAKWLAPAARAMASGEAWASQSLSDAPTLLFGAAAVGILVAAAHVVDVPGAMGGAALGGALLVAAGLVHRRRERMGSAALRAAVATVAALGLWVSAARTELRYDYYRFVGSDLRRRGDLEGALDAYIKANHYAPPDKDRRKQEADLRRLLNRPAD